jgi:glutamate racemase
VSYQVGAGLVELVEQGKSQSKEASELLQTYIAPMLDEKIDHLVLGCTHYPFFIPVLKMILPEGVVIDNPAPAVAKQTARVLSEEAKEPHSGIGTEPSVAFYTSGEIDTLKLLVHEIESSSKVVFKNKSYHHFIF